MQKRISSNAARKAWNILRLSLLWAKKGGVFVHKKRLMMHLPKFIKTLRNAADDHHRGGGGGGAGALYYGHRQLSFDDTPIFHVKMNRPNSMRFLFPCIDSQVDFDYDFTHDIDHDDGFYYLKEDVDVDRKSFLKNDGEDGGGGGGGSDDLVSETEEEGIDLRAEEFIAKFYDQLKLQKQISYLQYN